VCARARAPRSRTPPLHARRGEPNCVIALAGNKADAKERKVEPAEVKEYAADAGCIALDTSAKTGLNVKELFVAIAKKLPKSSREKDAEVIADLKAEAPEAAAGAGGCCGGK